jgi:hypothetical protein
MWPQATSAGRSTTTQKRALGSLLTEKTVTMKLRLTVSELAFQTNLANYKGTYQLNPCLINVQCLFLGFVSKV